MKTQNKMERKVAESILRERNMDNFKRLGFMEPPFFKIKMAYIPTDRIVSELVVGMFDSELTKTEGVYIELTDGDNLPLNTEPTLYYLPYRADYKQAYVNHLQKSGADRYLVPLDTLILVDIPKESKSTSNQNIELPQPTDEEYPDCHYSELTARDRACIDLRVPESNKQWLNDLIKKSNKQ